MIGPKAWVVVRREFVSTVSRKGWLIATLGMPVFLALYAAFAAFVGYTAEGAGKRTTKGATGIVDLAGIVRLEEQGKALAAVPEAVRKALELGAAASPQAAAITGAMLEGVRFESFPDEAAAMKALEAGTIGALFVVPKDYVATGKVVGYRPGQSIFDKTPVGAAAVRQLLARSLAAGRIDEATVTRILAPADVSWQVRQRDGSWAPLGWQTVVRSVGMPIGFTMLLLIALMVSSGYLLQGVSEEKENRVIEVILSSVDARSLLIGKLLGLGAAGLLQLAVWLAMTVVPLLVFAVGLVFSPVTVLLCLAYFVLGFLLFGALMTGTGVLGTNLKEMQQYGMLWSIGSVVPLMFLVKLLIEPNGTLARVLSYIPLTAPATMMMRLGSGSVPWWEIVLTLAILSVSVWLAITLAGRVFRTALLMYGKRPTIPEIIRWLRTA